VTAVSSFHRQRFSIRSHVDIETRIHSRRLRVGEPVCGNRACVQSKPSTGILLRQMVNATLRTTPPRLTSGARSHVSANAASGTVGELSIVRDPLRLLLLALTILTVSRVHQHYPMLMKLRPALLLVIAATGYAYLNPRFLTRENMLQLWPMRLIAILGVCACSSAVFGISLGHTATFFLEWYLKTLIYAFLLAVSIRHVRDLYTFVWAYVLSCGILSFFSLFVFGITKTGNSDFQRLSNLYTYDSNDLGVVLTIGLALTLLLLVSTRGGRRWFLFAILAGISATIARSGSRGGFLGLIAVALAALILANGVSVARRSSILIAAAVALMLGAPAGYWKQMSTVLEPKGDYNYSTLDGRKALAERGLGYMAMYPLFGLGMDNFSRAECTISPKLVQLNRTGPIRCTAPHNSYIQAGAELGVPGLLVWASIVFGVIYRLLGVRRRLPRSWRRGTDTERFLYGAAGFFPLAMIGFAVTAFFVSFAWADPIYIMAAFTAGFYVSLRSHLQETSGTKSIVPQAHPQFSHHSPGWRVSRGIGQLRVSRPLYSEPGSTATTNA
jgi:O-antigen ligase